MLYLAGTPAGTRKFRRSTAYTCGSVPATHLSLLKAALAGS